MKRRKIHRGCPPATGKVCVLLFVKAAEKGKVKSRLAPVVGEEAALEIYKQFVAAALETIERTGCGYRVCFYPPDARQQVEDWLGPGRIYRPQEGADLGERMKNAFIRSFSEGVERAVLVGSDIPEVTPALLRDALESLNTHDAVIGPALDGGYYLIGFNARSFLPRVFDGIAWSRDGVFGQTADVFKKAGTNVHALPLLQDIDTAEDLRAFAERQMSHSSEAWAAIRRILQHKELFQ